MMIFLEHPQNTIFNLCRCLGPGHLPGSGDNFGRFFLEGGGGSIEPFGSSQRAVSDPPPPRLKAHPSQMMGPSKKLVGLTEKRWDVLNKAHTTTS